MKPEMDRVAETARLVSEIFQALVQADGVSDRRQALKRTAHLLGWRAIAWTVLADQEILRRDAWPSRRPQQFACSEEMPGSLAGHHHRFEWTAGRSGDDVSAWLWQALVAADEMATGVAAALSAAQSPDREDRDTGFASVTEDGRIRSMDAAFKALLSQAFRGWDGRRLPFTLQCSEGVQRHGQVVGRLWVRARPQRGGFHVSARPDRRAGRITARELEVAARIARGLSFREVAEELGLAPSTVSTHVYKLNEKLGIRRRSELVHWYLSQFGPMPSDRRTDANSPVV